MTLKTDLTKAENAAATQTESKLDVSSKSYPANWENQLEQIIGGMREHKIDLGGDRTPDSLLARREALINTDRQIIELETRLDQLRDARQEQRLEIWQLGVSVRQAVSGLYGPNSMQYQAVGGRRASERKTSKRNPKA